MDQNVQLCPICNKKIEDFIKHAITENDEKHLNFIKEIQGLIKTEAESLYTINKIYDSLKGIVSRDYIAEYLEKNELCFDYERLFISLIKEKLGKTIEKIPFDNVGVDVETVYNKIHSTENITPFYIDENKNNYLLTNLTSEKNNSSAPFISVSKSMTFDAAHRLYNYNGPCNNLHGHTWKIEIEVKRRINKNGFVEDFKNLKVILNKIKDKIDHKYLNSTIEDFTYLTAENICVWVWAQLEFIHLLKGLVCVRVYESPDSCAELTTEDLLNSASYAGLYKMLTNM